MKMQFVKAFCVLFSILLIPLFFILVNYYTFDALKSFRQAYFFSQSVFVGLYKGASILDVKHPTAKAIGLPRLMLPVGRVWFSLCVPNHRDFTEFELQRIPYRSHTSYLQRRNFAHFLR